MLLGKRQRSLLKRTTSVTGITGAIDSCLESTHFNGEIQEPFGNDTANGNTDQMMVEDVCTLSIPFVGAVDQAAERGVGPFHNAMTTKYERYINDYSGGHSSVYDEARIAAMSLSPRYLPRNGEVETAHFLTTCGHCNHRLANGKDIYMYRGDTAFCSLECREKRIKQDERREKCKAVTSKRNDHEPPATSRGSEAVIPA